MFRVSAIDVQEFSSTQSEFPLALVLGLRIPLFLLLSLLTACLLCPKSFWFDLFFSLSHFHFHRSVVSLVVFDDDFGTMSVKCRVQNVTNVITNFQIYHR